MAPRQRSELYRLGVGLAAAGILAASMERLVQSRVDWWLVAALALAGILALAYPLHINLSTKMSVASAVFFAAVLLLPVWQAAALVELRRGAGTQWNPHVVEAAIVALSQEAPAEMPGRAPRVGRTPAVA